MKIKMIEFEYWYMGYVIISTTIFVAVFGILHTHVWVRNGYAGKNKILELHEVDRLVAHIMSEICLIMLWMMTNIEPLVQKYLKFAYTNESKYMFLAGFFGSGVYIAFRGQIRKLLKVDETDTKE